MEDLLEIYCSDHSDFYDIIEQLPENAKQKIIKNLQKAANKIKFRSTIAELQFGLLFQSLGFVLDYEKKYLNKQGNKQDPDWTVSIGSSTAICEVYRLGRSPKDQNRSDFQEELIKKIRELEFNYFISLRFETIDCDPLLFKVEQIIDELKNWFSLSEKRIGDTIVIMAYFSFEVLSIKTKSNHISCRGSFNLIDVKPGKLMQFDYLDDNKITKKISKYNEIISETKYPYFIAVSLDFASGFSYDEFEEDFLGKTVGFDYEDNCDMSPEESEWGTEWTELGRFYYNPQLSGLIILDNNRYRLLLNPVKTQAIYNDKNRNILDRMQKINTLNIP